MQLGAILSDQPGLPTASREIEFDLLIDRAGHPQTRKRVRAALCFVSEPDRALALKLADEQLRKDWPKGASADERFLEEQKFLFAQALRDPDDLAVKFVDADSLQTFRKGLIPKVVNWLTLEYGDFIEQEYPYCITPEARRKLEEEAAKNSGAGQDSSGRS